VDVYRRTYLGNGMLIKEKLASFGIQAERHRPHDTHALDGLNRLLPAELSVTKHGSMVRRGKRHSRRDIRYMVKHDKINEGVNIGNTRSERQKHLMYYTTGH
jgi:hypothetical protein